MKNYLRTVCAVLALLAATASRAQVPVMSSLPSATAVILLDFDGQTFDNTSWNYNGPMTVGPSGLDNAQITTIFNRVAEDYRPFNINITTDEAKYQAAPANRRQRILLTVSYEWYGISGGVAFIGSFQWTDDTPGFVFTSLHVNSYGQPVIKNIAEAASHEAGHTLGLYHQSLYNGTCGLISEYNSGNGTGEIGWAPIMGVGYYQNLTLWNNGQSSEGCAVIQNDLAVITQASNGFSYRNDDHGNSFAQATTANFSANQFNVNGIVERSTDMDIIKFTQPVYGRFQLNAVPYNVGTGNSGSDLDMQVSLYNNSQTLLNVYNPGNLLSSVIDTQLNAGTYYLRIEGRGNMYAPNYASLGSYSLQGQFSPGNPLPLRRLELHGEPSGDKHKLNWLIDADEQVVEQIVEISTDGMNFRPLNTPSTDARTFIYRPYANGTLQYRMNVTFDNGRQYYSNIVSLRQNGALVKPQLVSNVVNSGTMTVTSPGNFDYIVFDMQGKSIVKGNLAMGANVIAVPNLVNGMYLIRFIDGNEQFVDKFVKQ